MADIGTLPAVMQPAAPAAPMANSGALPLNGSGTGSTMSFITPPRPIA